MRKHKKRSFIKTGITLIASLLICVTFGMVSFAAPKSPKSIDEMQVHFIDVGQGDATLITCGEHAMLIDAGDNTKGTSVQSYIKKQGVKKLDYLVLTHPDADHIGGADVIVTKFQIDNVFMSQFTKDNKTYGELIDALDYKNMKWSTPKVGNIYTLGSAKFTILAPNKMYADPNNSSIALLIVNGNNKFLFTGDMQEEAENDILVNKLEVKADVYQVGHHGSKTSSSSNFLKAVKPTYAVISCGIDNSYGHPHSEVLNTLRSMGVQVFRTDEQGSIIATSDGVSISWNCAPSDTWQAGESVKTAEPKTVGSPKEEHVPEPLPVAPVGSTYVLNTNTKKFHIPTCSSVSQMKEKNKKEVTCSRDEVITQGYAPCKKCNP